MQILFKTRGGRTFEYQRCGFTVSSQVERYIGKSERLQ